MIVMIVVQTTNKRILLANSGLTTSNPILNQRKDIIIRMDVENFCFELFAIS
jgi:hypothetical protein